MPRYHLRTLGGLALVRTDQGSDEEALSNSKALLIPALLATRPGYFARRIDVAELLWPEGDRPRALRALRQALFYLSRYTDTVLERTEDTLTLDPATVSVDLWEFDRAVAAGDHAAVITLARGPFAAGQERKVGSEAEHWIEAINARVAVGLEVAYVREIERTLSEGAGADAVRLARAFAALNPLDEQRQRLLAQTLNATGDQVGALQALEAYRQLSLQALDEELSPELEARLQTIRDELRLGPQPAPSMPVRPQPPPVPDTRERVSRPAFVIRGRPISGTALAIAGGVVLLLLAVALARPRGPRAPGDPFDGVQGRLLAVARAGNTHRVVTLGLRGTAVDVTERQDLQPTDLPAPDGRTIATTFQTPLGWDLAVRVGGESPRVLAGAPGDEYPVAWSPDARYLLYAHRRILSDGRTQSFGLAMYDLVAGTARRLVSGLESREFPTAAWSPDGTRIAFTADARGVPEVFLVDFDGRNLRRLSRHPAWDGDPSWSPDGERIAFVSRRDGTAEVYGVRPDRTDLQRLTRGAGDKHRPVWLSPMVLAVLVGDDETARQLELLDTFTGLRVRVDAPPGLVALVAHPDPPIAWLDRLAITPRIQLASPGQYLAFGADATGPKGAPLPIAFPIEWSVTDAAVARLEAPGRIWIHGPGRTTIVASAAGWRVDTILVYSVPLAERDVPVAFEEDWTHGLEPERWRPFGDPAPLTRAADGPGGGGVFANRGDEFFASGVITREAFPLSGGLGVEVEGRMPFTGKLHQEFGVALYADDHPDSTLASGAAPALVEFRVQGPSGVGPAEAWIATPEQRVALPLPANPDQWHTYALQVLDDGGVELIVDGRMFWRAPEPLADRGNSIRIGLGFQSFETEIRHGRVRVFAPPRYYIPELVLEEDPPRTP
jgi:DNA-binding SARP family transcriptional activator